MCCGGGVGGGGETGRRGLGLTGGGHHARGCEGFRGRFQLWQKTSKILLNFLKYFSITKIFSTVEFYFNFHSDEKTLVVKRRFGYLGG